MFIVGLFWVSVFSACSTFVTPCDLRLSCVRMVMASVVSAAGLLMREPVTTTVCRTCSPAAGACSAAAGVCGPVAGVGAAAAGGGAAAVAAGAAAAGGGAAAVDAAAVD